jgi:UDP-N-acetylmuramyl pentapeptide phosphotransferase/UDP-N-acetylglucosamine-1-phosphate transferase
VKVKIRPRDRVLVIAMLIGVIIGAVLKLYLTRLQAQGVISRREVIMAVGITSLIGLVVSFVAVVGRIKIIAFDQMGSYDNPAVIFVISLAGAVGGAQLLSTFIKVVSSNALASSTAATAPAAPTTPATTAAAKPTA